METVHGMSTRCLVQDAASMSGSEADTLAGFGQARLSFPGSDAGAPASGAPVDTKTEIAWEKMGRFGKEIKGHRQTGKEGAQADACIAAH